MITATLEIKGKGVWIEAEPAVVSETEIKTFQAVLNRIYGARAPKVTSKLKTARVFDFSWPPTANGNGRGK